MIFLPVNLQYQIRSWELSCLNPLQQQFFFKNFIKCLFFCFNTPDLQLTVSPGNDLEAGGVPVRRREPDVPDKCSVAPAETLAQSQECREEPEAPLVMGIQVRDNKIFFPGNLLAMKPGQHGDKGHFPVIEPEKLGVPDNIIRMGMVVGE